MMSNISQYVNSLHGKSPKILFEIEQNNVTGDTIYPILGADAGRFLYTYILATKPHTILELGTGCGYATIWMAMATKTYGGKIISLDFCEDILNIAKQNLLKAELLEDVTLINTNAKTWVSNYNKKVDFILQDTYPKLYVEMLEDCLQILKKGKSIITHDAIVTPLKCYEDLARDMDAFNNIISNHPKLSSAIIPVNDGLWLSTKK